MNDGNLYKARDCGRYSPPALPPLPYGKHFSLFHLPRVSQDAQPLPRLRSQVRSRTGLLPRRDVRQLELEDAIVALFAGTAVVGDRLVDHERHHLGRRVVSSPPPTITLFARVLWIYLDQTIDPERPAVAHIQNASSDPPTPLQTLLIL